MPRPVAGVLFDLDGTLVDSVPDLAVAVDRAMARMGLPARGEARVREWVGNGVRNLIRRALAGDMAGVAPEPRVDEALAHFRAAYGEALCVHSRLYPGVREGLEQVGERGIPMACVTNKAAGFAAGLLEQIGIAHHFRALVGGDDVARHKPAPDALLLAAGRLGVAPARLLMVGDSSNDVGAARAAGCPVLCVSYGYNHGVPIAESNPDGVIDSIAELGTLLGPAT